METFTKFTNYSKPKIAVIMAVYKGDEVPKLTRAIESLEHQRIKDFDTFIWVDGPVSKEIKDYILESEEHRKGNIKRVKWGDSNLGLAAALNNLLEQTIADGYEYIARMDADDICTSDRFQLQLSFMERERSVDILGGWIEEFSDNSTKVVKYPETHEECKAYFIKRQPLAHVTIFARSSAYKKIQKYRTNTVRNEDYALLIDALKNKLIIHNLQNVLVFVDAPDDYYRRRQGVRYVISDLRLRIEAATLLNAWPKAGLYIIAQLVVRMAPSRIKAFMYKNFR